MMSTSKKPQNSVLSVADLEAALNLLTSEESFAVNNRKIIITSISDISIGLMLFGLIDGLITLTFNVWWGLSLLAFSLISFILMSIAVSSPDEVSNTTRRMKKAIAGTEIDEAVGIGWSSRESSPGVIAFVFIAFCVSTVVLAFGCFMGSLTIVLVGLIASGVFASSAGVYFAVDDYREFQYFSRVSKLREEFQFRLQDLASGEETIPLSSREKELLSEIETQHVDRNVARVLEVSSNERKNFYSIALSAQSLEKLGALTTEQRDELRKVIDSLQIEPRPANARARLQVPTENAQNEFFLSGAGFDIHYRVDEGKQRVDVLQIGKIAAEEVNNAS